MRHLFICFLMSIAWICQSQPQNQTADQLRDWASKAINEKDIAQFDKIETACQTYLLEKEKRKQKDAGYAETLISLGRIYEEQGQKEKALKAFIDAFEVNKNYKSSQPPTYLQNLKLILGWCNNNRSYTAQTEPYIKLFMDEYVKQQSDPDVYLVNIAEVIRYNFHTGHPEKSLPIIDGALSYTEVKLGKNSNEYILFKNYKAAIENGAMTKQEEKEFTKAAGLTQGSAEFQELQSYLDAGDLARATATFAKYANLLKNYCVQEKQYKSYVSILSAFVIYYRESGNLNKAFELLQENSAFVKEYLPADNDANIEALTSEGDFYKELGMDKKAETKYLETIKLLDATRTSQNEQENDDKYYEIWAKLGQVYRHWGYNKDAHSHFIAVADYKKGRFGENSTEYAKALVAIGEVSEASNFTGRSEWHFKKALGILEKNSGKTTNAYISAGEQYASLLVRMMKYKEAEPYQIAARDMYHLFLGDKSSSYLGATSDLAFQYVLDKNYTKAQPLFRELIQNNLYRVNNFFPSLSESEKAVFFRRVYADINAYNVFANRYGVQNKEEAGRMYDIQLSTKGILFKSSDRVRNTILQSNDDSLKATYNKWLETKNTLSQIYQLSSEQKKANAIDEKVWEEKVNTLERKLTKQAQFFSRILVDKSTWRNVQEKLLPGEAAIEIVKLIEPNYQYYYWKIDKGFWYDSLPNGDWSIYNIDSDRTPIYKSGARTRDVIVAINGVALKGKTKKEVSDLYNTNPAEFTLTREGGQPFKVNIKNDSVFYISMSRQTRYAALILTAGSKNGPDIVTLENGNLLETRYGTFYQNAIKQKMEDPYSYNQFWKPLQTKLTGIRKVYFSPDGVYNFINPNTLYNPATKKYLLDEMEVVIVNNTSDILLPKPKKEIRKAILIGFPDYNKKTGGGKAEENLSSDVDYRAITADTSATRFMSGSAVANLPGTKTEVESIESILKGSKCVVDKLMMAEASEEKVKSLHSPDVLHIATHGFFMNELSELGEGARSITGVTEQKLRENPLLRSGLLLSGSGETIANGKSDNTTEDGILTAYEAMNLDLSHTALVVLSACETGLGQLKSGEGVYGLNRAFRTAGAKSVLMSLWKVDDAATQQLMTAFYHEWLKGSGKQQAFRKAQQKLRESFSHPYYWGAFVVVGD